MDLKREFTTLYTEKKIKAFRRKQASCKHDERDVLVGPYEIDEPVCRDDSIPTPHSFFFSYATVSEKLGLRLLFNTFEKELLKMLNMSPIQLHPNS